MCRCVGVGLFVFCKWSLSSHNALFRTKQARARVCVCKKGKKIWVCSLSLSLYCSRSLSRRFCRCFYEFVYVFGWKQQNFIHGSANVLFFYNKIVRLVWKYQTLIVYSQFDTHTTLWLHSACSFTLFVLLIFLIFSAIIIIIIIQQIQFCFQVLRMDVCGCVYFCMSIFLYYGFFFQMSSMWFKILHIFKITKHLNWLL